MVSVLGEIPERGVTMTVETEIKYAGYIVQQDSRWSDVRHSGQRHIPSDMEFKGIPGLSREVSEKLARVRPATLDQAARIPGVTPAAVSILDIYLILASRP